MEAQDRYDDEEEDPLWDYEEYEEEDDGYGEVGLRSRYGKSLYFFANMYIFNVISQTQARFGGVHEEEALLQLGGWLHQGLLLLREPRLQALLLAVQRSPRRVQQPTAAPGHHWVRGICR